MYVLIELTCIRSYNLIITLFDTDSKPPGPQTSYFQLSISIINVSPG